jgi:hypothetical protein
VDEEESALLHEGLAQADDARMLPGQETVSPTSGRYFTRSDQDSIQHSTRTASGFHRLSTEGTDSTTGEASPTATARHRTWTLRHVSTAVETILAVVRTLSKRRSAYVLPSSWLTTCDQGPRA